MSREYAPRIRIDHFFCIAVISRDQGLPTHHIDFINYSAEIEINRFNCFDRRFDTACMSNHVGIGKIQYDEIKIPLIQSIHQSIRHFICGHFRFQIICRHPRRLY